MKPEIVKADEENLIEIIFLLRQCANDLISKGFSHWNSAYPSHLKVQDDLKNGRLYLLKQNGGTIGVITLNAEQDSSYGSLTWKSDNHALIINRLAIIPIFQNQGFAKLLMTFAEEFAKNNGYKSIRLDTFAGNENTVSFFEKCGFSKVGEVSLSIDRNIYACLEKQL